LQTNQDKTSGVLHLKNSEQCYDLRRYFPEHSFAGLVEQFWFVDWQLVAGESHTQKNLPDPNFHLIYNGKEFRLIGPVSKLYCYDMSSAGRIIGVKFLIGGLTDALNQPLSNYVDGDFVAKECLPIDFESLENALLDCDSDEQRVTVLQKSLTPLLFDSTPEQQQLLNLFNMIKTNQGLFSVAQLAESSGLSVRKIQRLFQKRVGLSPKHLLRKYRLHQVLAAMENGDLNTSSLFTDLEYSDQSHFIRDFKGMTGITPEVYLTQRGQSVRE